MGGKAGGRLLGGVDGCVVLKRILKAIDDLLEVEPTEGAKVHWVVHAVLFHMCTLEVIAGELHQIIQARIDVFPGRKIAFAAQQL